MELKIDTTNTKCNDIIIYNKIYNATIISNNYGLQLPYCYYNNCSNMWVKNWIRAGKPLIWNNFTCNKEECLIKNISYNNETLCKYQYMIGYTACGDLIYFDIIKSLPFIKPVYKSEPMVNIIISKFNWSSEDFAASLAGNKQIKE